MKGVMLGSHSSLRASPLLSTEENLSSFSNRKIIIYASLTAILLIFFCISFLFKGNFFIDKSLKNKLYLILPQGERIQKVENVGGGFSNYLWRVETDKGSYVFREPKSKDSSIQFESLLHVSRHASEQELSPKLVGENVDEQHILLEYIDHIPWPSYEENSSPYHKTMKLLRAFHETMQPFVHELGKGDFAPFDFILSEGQSLEEIENMPVQFSTALRRLEEMLEGLKPWLRRYATLCHGDFHRGNVLLNKKNGGDPTLIDFDSMMIGDPIFDVVKFSIFLEEEARLKLFEEYLGGRQPTPEEQAHFEQMDLALLMVIAVVRFKSALKVREHFQELLTKDEVEAMLNSEEFLPSFREVPFDHTSPRARQIGAIYALGEFLNRTSDL
jgi:aminoglycoside phosphotransferase (APT) family kinase protein